jgi:predicted ATPase/DNA-binding winged helix-turn-helix (wHTH) protein
MHFRCSKVAAAFVRLGHRGPFAQLAARKGGVSDEFAAVVEETLSFGPFELFRGARILVRNGQRVRIGGRALDILIALVERAGDIVTKNELISVAWPHTFVDESNLRVHIAALRKLLSDGLSGDRFLVNIAGRGYLFAAPVARLQPSDASPPPEPLFSPGLPANINRLVGRDATVDAIVNQLDRHRLTTIVGPGGVGKSAVALAVSDAAGRARRLCFVDLSPIASPELLPAAIAAALDVSILTRDPISNLVAFLADQDLLLILDNCEHIIEAVAGLIETLLRMTGVRFLLTSREPLLANGEVVVRLQPLETPAADLILNAVTALQYPAIRLFVDRAANNSDTFEFGDAEAKAVAEICQRLDGLPLAIELIAARVDLFGIGALATDLGERLMLGARGSRTAQPRQQSIRGALDWSHDLLSPSEKLVFRRFSVFRGLFSLESAVAVVADASVSTDEVLDAVALLTAKSLLSTDTTGTRALYRLLHVTRIYAAEKLDESGESSLMVRRHARHFRDLLTTAEAQWEILTRLQWLDAHGYTIDDVRGALDWAFSPDGDVEIGATLITASLPFGFQLSLIDEFKVRAERALDFLDTDHASVAKLRLVTALVQFALNSSVDEAALKALFDRVEDLCSDIGETKFKIEPLLARAVYFIERGEHAIALEGVVSLGKSARTADDPLGILATDRIEAQAQHFVGNFPKARLIAERVIRHPARSIPLLYSPATMDRQITMRIVIARSLWIEGRVDQATGLMSETLDMAYRDGPLPITYTLAMGACLIAFWTGNEAAARGYTDELLGYGRRYTLERWQRLGEGFAGVLDRRGADTRKEHVLGLHIAEPVSEMHRMLLASVDSQLVNAALGTRADQGLCGWCNPEILRVLGEETLRRGGHEATASAQRYFERAIAEAQQQGALSWELRASMSLATLWQRQHRTAAAGAVLVASLGRFSEGFETADLRRAATLLEQLHAS